MTGVDEEIAESGPADQRPAAGRHRPQAGPVPHRAARGPAGPTVNGLFKKPSSSLLSNGSTGSTIVASFEPIGNMPPAEAEERYYTQMKELALAA